MQRQRCLRPIPTTVWAGTDDPLNKAFADGASGNEPLANAARVEAGLLWFLYVSTYKEANSCASKERL